MNENNPLICREGKGIKLFINPDSNYGINKYTPIEKDHPLYNKYLRYKENLEKYPNYEIVLEQNGNILSHDATIKFIHCMGCNAAKINNYRRYCCTCSDYVDLYDKENYIEIKDFSSF